MTTATSTVLVVEDDLALRTAVREALAPLGARIQECGDGREALDRVREAPPDALILDLGLPGADGLEVCRELRRWTTLPILVLSARSGEADKVALLDAGADDYVTKPFSVAELVARMQALLRRAALGAAPRRLPVLVDGNAGVHVDIAARRALRDGEAVRLTPIEWLLLEALGGEPGRTLTHRQLFDRVWGREFGNPQQYLRVHLTHLRRKIEPVPAEPRWIVTEPGVGYRLEVDGAAR
jgi:two-component system KDP operon response regulator KdpE